MSLSFNQTLPKHYGMFINGEFVPSLSGKTREIHNPANGELLATVAEGDAKDVDRAVALAVSAFGGVDIVVNNAGYTHKNQPFLNVDEASFDRCFDVNVKAIYHMINAVVPMMRLKKSGCIINTGSTAGIRPRPGLTWYNASKGAANLLTKSLAVELAPDNIRVNVICPVIGDTAMLGDFMGVPDTPENRARFIATIPMGRMSQPRDIANAAVFLASDEASFLTGVELPVDGGRTI
jgi:3-oxoacyl-[acyl-carrier protein] reductase